mgnify:CR=1 FL=1
MNTSIFKDLKIVELASVLAGPSVGMFFAELGAKVIKFENTLTNGDVTRSWKIPNENTINTSAIADYKHKSQTLEVTFLDGSTYEYFGVNKTLFSKLVNADKMQRFARRNIFNSFTYRKSKRTIEQE